MAIMYKKGTDYSILKSLGVSFDARMKLKSLGVALSVGTNVIWLECGSEKSELSFVGLGLNNAVKNPQQNYSVAIDGGTVSSKTVADRVNEFVKSFISAVVSGGLSKNPDGDQSFTTYVDEDGYTQVVDKPSESLSSLVKGTVKFLVEPVNPDQQPKYKKFGLDHKFDDGYKLVQPVDYSTLPVCKLRDATVLYQRVEGTNPASVYRLVAANDKVKMAVRVVTSPQSVTLSVRVEGDTSVATENKLTAYGLSKKNNGHFSGHFDCEHCSPDSLIGAIIMGSGIRFTTPIPEYEKVCK